MDYSDCLSSVGSAFAEARVASTQPVTYRQDLLCSSHHSTDHFEPCRRRRKLREREMWKKPKKLLVAAVSLIVDLLLTDMVNGFIFGP